MSPRCEAHAALMRERYGRIPAPPPPKPERPVKPAKPPRRYSMSRHAVYMRAWRKRRQWRLDAEREARKLLPCSTLHPDLELTALLPLRPQRSYAMVATAD